MKSRDIILNDVKKAVQNQSEIKTKGQDLDEALIKQIEASCVFDPEEMVAQFKEELEKVSGEFYHIQNIEEAADIIEKIMQENRYNQIAVTKETICMEIAHHLVKKEPSFKSVPALSLDYPERKNRLETIPIALVYASYAISDLGSVVFPYDDTGTSLPHFLSNCIIAVVSSGSLVPSQFHLFQTIEPEKTGNMVFVTGPSRTADIEKILILGAHGPRRLVVLMING